MSMPSEFEILQNPEIYRQGAFRMGLWRGRVVNTADPERRGRVQVRILQLHPVPGAREVPVSAKNPAGAFKSLLSDAEVQNQVPSTGTFSPIPEVQVGPNVVAPPTEGVSDRALPWAEPCFPFGGRLRKEPPLPGQEPGPDGNLTEGFFAVPSVGSTVWIAFENNFTGRPVYLGTWYGFGEIPEEIPPLPFDPANIKLLKTPAGHLLLFDDAEGQERVFLGTFDKDEATKTNHLRFLEMKDSDETVSLEQTSQDETEEQRLKLDLPGKLAEFVNSVVSGTIVSQHLKMNRTDETVELLHEDSTNTLRLLLDIANNKLTIEYPPESVVIEPNKITITSVGGNSVVLDGSAGSWTVSVTGTATRTCVTDIVNCTTHTNNATGTVLLGTGAAQGVVLDSIIAVIAAAYAVFNTHTHLVSGSPIGGPFDPPGSSPVTMIPPVLGINSSLTVRAKL